MTTFRKKFFRLNTVKVNLGCGSCRKPKLSDIYNPKPKAKYPTYYKHKNYYANPISSSSGEKEDSVTTASATPTTASTTPFSPCQDYSDKRTAYMNTPRSTVVGGFGRIGDESVAVEKDSDDPYLDFRHSMLQMIWENQIYSKEDLKELLNCFLQLNSPYHHGIIIRAFTEIWNGVSSNKLHFGRLPRDHF